MENLVSMLIYTHAFLGGVGLVAGLSSVLVKKGGAIHKKAGKIFTYSILSSSLISLLVARMPDHENLFLFLIGVFTIYLILSGNMALSLKSKSDFQVGWKERLTSGSMLLVSMGMLLLGILGIIQKVDNSFLYLFFGGFGATLAYRDFIAFRTFKENKKVWLINHIGRMVGALIASFTAFLVAGLHIGTTLVWILPTVIGTIYIIYSSRKYKV